MFLYDYKCDTCEEITEEPRDIDSRNDPGKCVCGGVTRRIFDWRGHVGTGTFKEGHYHAFGKDFTSPHQLKEEIAKIKGETGKEIVEVGSDSMQTMKKTRKKVDWDAATKELRHMVKHGRTNITRTAEDSD